MTPDLARALADLDPDQPLLVALDFDGTLSHLVAEPGLARPAPGVLEWLTALEAAAATDVVIISGRALHDLATVSGAADLALLIGSHGQEHGGSDPLGPHEAALLARARSAVGALAGVPGVRIEDKPAGFAVHVRHCSDEDAARVVDRVHDLARAEPHLHLIEGKMVVEVSVRPLDKGRALARLMGQQPGRRVLFAGDDVTDEAAMAVLGPRDISIKVGPGDTSARYRVANPTEMVEVLEALARTRAGSAGAGG